MNVRIGPYAVVEAGASIGDGCVISAHATIAGCVRMGPSNFVGVGAVLGEDPQDLRFNAETRSYVTIGARNQIREHCTLHRATVPEGSTVVGDECLLMVGVHLGHDARVGNGAIFANGTMLGGFVMAEDGVFLGGGTLVHQHVRIGRRAISQGNSTLTKDVPPYAMVALLNKVVGLNTVGLKRMGMDLAKRNEVKKAFHLLYRSGVNFSQALESARQSIWSVEVAHFWDFVSGASKRGICAPIARRKTQREEAEE